VFIKEVLTSIKICTVEKKKKDHYIGKMRKEKKLKNEGELK
jgi:hypothetical protein